MINGECTKPNTASKCLGSRCLPSVSPLGWKMWIYCHSNAAKSVLVADILQGILLRLLASWGEVCLPERWSVNPKQPTPARTNVHCSGLCFSHSDLGKQCGGSGYVTKSTIYYKIRILLYLLCFIEDEVTGMMLYGDFGVLALQKFSLIAENRQWAVDKVRPSQGHRTSDCLLMEKGKAEPSNMGQPASNSLGCLIFTFQAGGKHQGMSANCILAWWDI